MNYEHLERPTAASAGSLPAAYAAGVAPHLGGLAGFESRGFAYEDIEQCVHILEVAAVVEDREAEGVGAVDFGG